MRMPRIPARGSLARGILALMLFVSARGWGAEAASFRFAAGSAPYGDWTANATAWGDGYPAVSGVFAADESLVFPPAEGGGYRQKIGTNTLDPGTTSNDNPAFTGVYPTSLRLNALIADTGVVALTYTLAFATELVDILVCDVDEDDSVVVSATDAAGVPIPASSFARVSEGDLSLTINAGGRPPLELATPPAWNPGTGALVAQVAWNENRSFTVLRPLPGVAVKTVTLTFDGARADSDGPAGAGLGSHIYAGLWPTPRRFEIREAVRQPGGSLLLRWTSLPGLGYRVERSLTVGGWGPVVDVTGASSPATTTDHTVVPDPAAPRQFYRVIRP
jgi:hypothetical protein